MGSAESTSNTLIAQCISQVARWVPHQGPLKDFIHHNPLHAFQNYPFREACLRASRLYGSWTFLPLSVYREFHSNGKIDARAIESTVRDSTLPIARLLRSEHSPEQWPEQLLSDRWGQYRPPPTIIESGLRSRWRSIHHLKLNHRVHPKLFRLLGQYLDQGVATGAYPLPANSFLGFIRELTKNSLLPLRPWSSASVTSLLYLPPEEIVHRVLRRFLGEGQEDYYEHYLLEMCLAHPGWSGMARELESHPEYLLEPRNISLLELSAVELMAEYAYISHDLGRDFPPLINSTNPPPPPLPYSDDYELGNPPAEQAAELLQGALETTYRMRLMMALERPPTLHSPQAEIVSAPTIQAFFCLDDREESVRRHLEAQNPAIETFGFPGFFGVDCMFQGVDDAFPSRNCPAQLHPKHLIRELRKNSRREVRSLRLHELPDHPDGLIRGFLASQTLGLGAALKLAISIFRPNLNPLTSSSLQRVDTESTLEIHASERNGYRGYSHKEMADRLESVLRFSGLIAKPFAKLVVFVGHGSSSTNNPYFAAYDCGACSGRSGGPNARAVALMGNNAEVRAVLRARGLDIPESTYFLGALHDTTRDEMQFYDLEGLPQAHRSLFRQLREDFERALAHNAKERCGRFANLPPKLDPRDAILTVRRRSASIFEPRPELNHATNACCIVGTRRLTKGINLNRQAFLNSYDPRIDPDGEILASLLAGVITVCGGINLEYYFSRMDPSVYGSGSKLPHNIQGLVGVINGTEGDLLTGLPTQMTEVHDPLRMLFIVEQNAAITQRAVESNPTVYQWVNHHWIQLMTWDCETQAWHEWRENGMRAVEEGER